MKQAKRSVGVFGAYHYGNYGDDLMGVIFASEIAALGYGVSVYGLQDNLVDSQSYSVTNDLQQFLDNNDIFVIGGGGMFLSGVAESSSSVFERNLISLLDHCRDAGKKLACFSVGGDAVDGAFQISEGRERLLSEAAFISFRNINDQTYIAQRNKPSEIADDIVWLVSDLFGVAPSNEGSRNIGIDIALGDRYSRINQRLKAEVMAVYASASLRQFKLRHSSFLGPQKNKSVVSYNSISGCLNELGSQKLVVASRLHFGMSAWSIGVPALLINPLPKAHIAWSEAGLSEYIYHSRVDMARDVRKILDREFELPESVQESIARKKSGAKRHLQYLAEFLD